MATENRVIQVETGATIIRVEGPDSLRAQEALMGRLLDRISDKAGRLPMGFQAGSSIVIERAEEL